MVVPAATTTTTTLVVGFIPFSGDLGVGGEEGERGRGEGWKSFLL